MTFGAGMFGSLMPRPQATMGGMRPTGPSNLAQQTVQGWTGGQGFSGMPMLGGAPQQQAAPAANPTAPGRIPVSGMAPASLAGLFAEADKMAKQSNTPPATTQDGKPVNSQGDWLTGKAPTTAEEAWAQYQADNQFLQNHHAMIGNPLGLSPETQKYLVQQREKEVFMRNFGAEGGSSPETKAASEAAMKDAQAFLKGLGLG